MEKKKRRIVVMALLSFWVIYESVESRAMNGNLYPLMTQCVNSGCSPVAYSNDCIAGGNSCVNRGCPKGSQEDYMYP